MNQKEFYNCLENNPMIAAVYDNLFNEALKSPLDIIFLLGCDVLTVKEKIDSAKAAGKSIFIHIDLAEGIGKDRAGVEYLARLGADGIISTKANIIRYAKDFGMLTVQRFFVYDSHGVSNIQNVLENTCPDVMEIMPGVIGKIIEKFSFMSIPLIAGGLIETKSEVTAALNMGAYAVSTGKKELWHL